MKTSLDDTYEKHKLVIAGHAEHPIIRLFNRFVHSAGPIHLATEDYGLCFIVCVVGKHNKCPDSSSSENAICRMCCHDTNK